MARSERLIFPGARANTREPASVRSTTLPPPHQYSVPDVSSMAKVCSGPGTARPYVFGIVPPLGDAPPAVICLTNLG